MRRTGYVEPIQQIPEHRAERMSEAVKVEHLPYEVFHGLTITDDQALEMKRVKVREDLARNLESWTPERKAAEQILDERVTQKLKDIVAREVSVEQQQRGWVMRNLRRGLGFLRNVKAMVYREHSDDVGIQFENRYDRGNFVKRWILRYDRLFTAPTADQMRKNVATDAWRAITPAEQSTLAGIIATNAGIPASIVTPERVIGMMAGSTPAELTKLREQAINAGIVGLGTNEGPDTSPLFPPIPKPLHSTPFDRLVQLQGVYASERKKLLSKTVYDATKLQNFLDGDLQQQPQINDFVYDMLKEGQLYPLEKNPEAQSLVAYLQMRINTDPKKSSTHDLQLQDDLAAIRNGLPASEKAEPDKEQAEKMDNIRKQAILLQNQYFILRRSYDNAAARGMELFYKQVQNNMPRSLIVTGGAAKVAVNDNVGERLAKEISDIENEQKKIMTQVRETEEGYQETWSTMKSDLEAVNQPCGIAGLTGANDLKNLMGVGTPPLRVDSLPNSTPDQLFGDTQPPPYSPPPASYMPKYTPPPNSAFKDHIITAFTPSQVREALGGQLKNNLKDKVQKPREKLTCRQLLYLLKERDVMRSGITNEELRRKYAMLSTNLMITDVKNEELFLAANERIGERLGGTIMGSFFGRRLHRIRKLILSLAGSKNYLRGEDLIALTAGMNGEFAMFRELPRDATITELRELIVKNGGITPDKMTAFAEYLRAVIVGFDMLKKEGKVRLFDRHAMQLENLVELLTTVREEIRAEKFFNEIRGTGGDKATNILKKLADEEVLTNREDEEVLTKVRSRDAEWKNMMSKRKFTAKYMEEYRKARKYIEDNGMTTGEAEDYLGSKGLLAAHDSFSTKESIKEAWDTTASVTGSAAKKTYETMKKAHIPGPIKKTGDFLVVRPVKWVGRGVGSVVSTAAGIVTLPFRLMGALGRDISKLSGKNPAPAPTPEKKK